MNVNKLIIILFVGLLLIGCTSKKVDQDVLKDESETIVDKSIPLVTIEMENSDIIEVELYPQIAPNTVSNFISLIDEEFYDGVSFHRVIPGFMIQGGDPEGTGAGGPDYTIDGEFNSNGFENDLSHERGVLSMARTNQPNSAGSQFFIMVKDSLHLDGEYAGFGKVISGIENVDKIVDVERDASDRPLAGSEQIMKKVTVELNDYKKQEVEKN